MERRRKFWGWGYEGEGPDDAQAAGIARTLGQRFGISELNVAPAPRIEDVSLRAPRLDPPAGRPSVRADRALIASLGEGHSR